MRHRRQDSSEEIISYLASPAGTRWSRNKHQDEANYSPGAGVFAKIFFDDERCMKATAHMPVSEPEAYCAGAPWDDASRITLKGSDIPPERI